MPKSLNKKRLAVSSVLLACLACSTELPMYYWDKQLLRADRNVDRGSHLIARLQYTVLEPFVPTVKERDHIHYMEARMLEAEGQYERALYAYKELWRVEQPDIEDEYAGYAL